MRKITTSYLKKLTKKILVDGCIPKLRSEDIYEFKVGKNFFYEVKNNDDLKRIQRVLNKVLQRAIPLNNAAVAFREHYSYLHLFEPHRKNYFFMRLDIKSFFHSIKIDDVKEVMKEYFVDAYIDENNNQKVLDAFMNLISYKIPDDSINEKFRGKQVIPMGFVTSPAISNIVFRILDIQIQKYCTDKNIVYTRYADDMLFSSDNNSKYVNSKNFEIEISILIAQLGFKLNLNKTIKKEHTISLNGYTIQYSYNGSAVNFSDKNTIVHELRLSNKKINIIKKLIHMIDVEGKSHTHILKKLFNYKLPMSVPLTKRKQFERDQMINRLTGYRSYILSFIVFNDKFNCLQDRTLKKYLKIIDDLNKIIDSLY